VVQGDPALHPVSVLLPDWTAWAVKMIWAVPPWSPVPEEVGRLTVVVKVTEGEEEVNAVVATSSSSSS
jgi:hypothetical protein